MTSLATGSVRLSQDFQVTPTDCLLLRDAGIFRKATSKSGQSTHFVNLLRPMTVSPTIPDLSPRAPPTLLLLRIRVSQPCEDRRNLFLPSPQITSVPKGRPLVRTEVVRTPAADRTQTNRPAGIFDSRACRPFRARKWSEFKAQLALSPWDGRV